jgi:hypothetical protein
MKEENNREMFVHAQDSGLAVETAHCLGFGCFVRCLAHMRLSETRADTQGEKHNG